MKFFPEVLIENEYSALIIGPWKNRMTRVLQTFFFFRNSLKFQYEVSHGDDGDDDNVKKT